MSRGRHRRRAGPTDVLVKDAGASGDGRSRTPVRARGTRTRCPIWEWSDRLVRTNVVVSGCERPGGASVAETSHQIRERPCSVLRHWVGGGGPHFEGLDDGLEGGEGGGGALHSAAERASVGPLDRVGHMKRRPSSVASSSGTLRGVVWAKERPAPWAAPKAGGGDGGSRVWASGFSECHGSGCNFKRLGRAFARPRAASPFS
jgi:hypothetical protein